MRSLRSVTLTAALVAVLAGVGLSAQGPGPGGRFGRGGPGGHGGPGGFGGPGASLPLRDLDLTAAQREQIRTLMQQKGDQNRAVMDRFRKAAEAHRKAMTTIPANESLIRSTAQELAEVQTELSLERARTQTEVFELLTPAQQGTVRKLQQERESRMSQRMQERNERLQQRRQQRQQR